jgi:hypothetical protein
MDPLAITDIFRFSHLLVVAVGFGAATLADVYALSRIHRRVDTSLITTLHSCHRLVWTMLIMMWITGTVMVFIRTGFDLHNFTPKLFSKLGTVAILTANALLISRYAMPIVIAAQGRSLLTLPLRSKLLLAAIGAVSTASWLMGLAMGVSKVLAASNWIVFLAAIPAFYVFSMLLAIAVMFLVHVGMMVRHHDLAAETDTLKLDSIMKSFAA